MISLFSSSGECAAVIACVGEIITAVEAVILTTAACAFLILSVKYWYCPHEPIGSEFSVLILPRLSVYCTETEIEFCKSGRVNLYDDEVAPSILLLLESHWYSKLLIPSGSFILERSTVKELDNFHSPLISGICSVFWENKLILKNNISNTCIFINSKINIVYNIVI